MTNDLVASMLTNIQNANKVCKEFTICKYNKLNINILNILIAENYILNYEIIEKNTKIKINLKYTGVWIKKGTFSIFRKISKSGKRIYCKYKQLKNNINILNFYKGIAIISTSNGLITHHKAINLKKGGEIICYIE